MQSKNPILAPSAQTLRATVAALKESAIHAAADGTFRTDSLAVAATFDKAHKNILQDIQNLQCSAGFTGLNFQPSEYKDSTGRTLPKYDMTFEGFCFLALGYTGKNAALFKEAYITAFGELAKTNQDRLAAQAAECERLEEYWYERYPQWRETLGYLDAGYSPSEIALKTGYQLQTIWRHIRRQSYFGFKSNKELKLMLLDVNDKYIARKRNDIENGRDVQLDFLFINTVAPFIDLPREV